VLDYIALYAIHAKPWLGSQDKLHSSRPPRIMHQPLNILVWRTLSVSLSSIGCCQPYRCCSCPQQLAMPVCGRMQELNPSVWSVVEPWQARLEVNLCFLRDIWNPSANCFSSLIIVRCLTATLENSPSMSAPSVFSNSMTTPAMSFVIVQFCNFLPFQRMPKMSEFIFVLDLKPILWHILAGGGSTQRYGRLKGW